jgi:MSHA biogenesis protein MshG
MRSLSGLQEAAINPEMKRVIGEVRESLEGGRELSQTLARHPRVFSSFYLSMVRVGEATGLLDEIFFRLFEHLEFERYMREQVKSALRYPSFVVLVMVMALVIVNLFVIPAFAKVFAGFGAELPMLTRVLLGFSDFMVAYWPSLLLGVIGLRNSL